jgi:ribosomal protein S18 acetylase RimI-like enzyme
MAPTDPAARLHIRTASVEDAQALAEVHVASWNHNYRGILPDETLAGATLEKRLAQWQRLLASLPDVPDRETVFVGVESSGLIRGFVHGGKEREADTPFDAEIYAIYLHPEAQRHGLGTRLCGHMAAWFAAHGYKTLRLWVLEKNPARAFYERLGGRLLSEFHDDVYAGVTVRHLSYGWDDAAALAQRLPR